LNKVWYQSSTFVAAFCQMMANKGYTLSDASITTLEAVLAHVITDADLKTPLITVTYSATPIFDCSQANGFVLTLAGNVTSTSLINMQIGQIVTIVVQENGTGGFTFVPPTNIQSGHWFPIDTGANTINVQQFTMLPTGQIVRVDTADLDLQSAIATINAALATIGSEITTIQSQITTLLSDVSTINGEISTINGEITTLQSNYTTLSGVVSGLSSQLSTFMAAFTGLFTQNGYFKFGNGLIIQWGLSTNPSGGLLGVTFPIAFPNACLNVLLTNQNNNTSGAGDRIVYGILSSLSTTGFEWIANGSFATGGAMWVAIGY
jgi:hypothetical protein